MRYYPVKRTENGAMITELRELWKSLPVEDTHRVFRAIWPCWVGVLLICFAMPMYWVWGMWPTIGVDIVALLFMLPSYLRIRPMLDEVLRGER